MKKLEMLEAVRGAAAVYVFFHHSHLMGNEGFGRLFYFGQEAVIVFFLLSGFVIRFATKSRSVDFRSFIIGRFVRIYPIFVMSLLLAGASGLFLQGHGVDVRLGADDFLANLFMLQDVSSLKRGVWFDTYGGNAPLWSLSYEWWFYVLYGVIAILGRRSGWFLPLIISLVGYLTYEIKPNQISLFASYFYIWWCGVEMANEYFSTGKVSFVGQLQTSAVCCFMTVLWLLPVLRLWLLGGDIKLGVDPFLQFRHSASALVFVAIIVLAFWWRFEFRALRPVMTVPLWFASISYAIYVIHQPVLNIFSFIMPESNRFAVVGCSFIVVLMLSWLLEKRIQPLMRRITGY